MRRCYPLALLLFATLAWASDDPTDRATLKGVPSVCLVVDVSSAASKGGVGKKALQAQMEGRLRQAGIAIEPAAKTCLYLDTRALQPMARNGKSLPLFAIDCRLEFLQTVTLTRDPAAKTFAPTWSSANMATAPAEDLGPTALDLATGLVDRFAAAYRSVNPQ